MKSEKIQAWIGGMPDEYRAAGRGDAASPHGA